MLSTKELVLVIFCLFAFLFFTWRFCSRYFSLPCPSWLGWMVELDNPLSKINRAATIVEHLELQSGMTVLDAGCGPGRLTIPVAKKIGPNGNVVAMDIQADMLRRVQEKTDAARLKNVAFLRAGIGEGKLERNTFDRALLVTVLGEIPDQKKALQEIFNALKSGGILCVTEIVFDPHYQRYGDVAQLAQEVGFRKKNLFSDWFAYSLLLEKVA